MKLKSTPEAINDIAARFPLEKLSEHLAFHEVIKNWDLFESLKQGEATNMLDIDSNIHVLREAIKLASEFIIYAFDISDEKLDEMWENGYGVMLYKRIWERLVDFYVEKDWWAPTIEESIEFLQKRKISEVYTWSIPFKNGFLGLSDRYDVDSHDNEHFCAIETKILEEWTSRTYFEEAWIKVTVLDILV